MPVEDYPVLDAVSISVEASRSFSVILNLGMHLPQKTSTVGCWKKWLMRLPLFLPWSTSYPWTLSKYHLTGKLLTSLTNFQEGWAVLSSQLQTCDSYQCIKTVKCWSTSLPALSQVTWNPTKIMGDPSTGIHGWNFKQHCPGEADG